MTSSNLRQVYSLQRTNTVYTTATNIQFCLVPNTSYDETFNKYYRCSSRMLPDDLHELLQFTTTVERSYKIPFMGDSVSMQLSQIYEEAAGSHHCSVLKYSYSTMEGIYVAGTNGGSVIAGYRILHLLRMEGLWKQTAQRIWGWLENRGCQQFVESHSLQQHH